jgi:hypothetical protein
MLGHRLVELLHLQGAFDLDEPLLRSAGQSLLTALFEREGALLLRPGMAFERHQLTRQLLEAVAQLQRVLNRAGLKILSVEEAFEVEWQESKLEGRLDLLAATTDGKTVIIDMKWGIAEYRDLLRGGRALQLAAYVHAHARARGSVEPPHAAYFSLKQAKLLSLPGELFERTDTVDGPSLAETWQSAERSSQLALAAVSRGEVSATGLRRSLPLLRSLGVNENADAAYFVETPEYSCKHCGFDAICGRRWEALQ